MQRLGPLKVGKWSFFQKQIIQDSRCNGATVMVTLKLPGPSLAQARATSNSSWIWMRLSATGSLARSSRQTGSSIPCILYSDPVTPCRDYTVTVAALLGVSDSTLDPLQIIDAFHRSPRQTIQFRLCWENLEIAGLPRWNHQLLPVGAPLARMKSHHEDSRTLQHARPPFRAKDNQ